MGTFFPGQRYTSKGEPELGVGIITETSRGKIQLHFPISNEMRLYALERRGTARLYSGNCSGEAKY